MIYSFSLSSVAIVIGSILFLTRLPGLLWPERTMKMIRDFPRHVPTGIVLMAINLVWATWLAATLDLGEFSSFRPLLVIATLVLGGLMIFLSREFLAVRAFAVFLLLLANVILDAAFLRNDGARLVMTALAYIWVTMSIVLLFSPYRLRDAIAFATATEKRFRGLMIASGLVGLLLVGLGIFVY